MIINRGRKISSLLNKKHPFSGFKLWYFIPLKKIKVKKKIQGHRRFEKKGTGYFFLNEKDCFYAWIVNTEKVACPLFCCSWIVHTKKVACPLLCCSWIVHTKKVACPLFCCFFVVGD